MLDLIVERGFHKAPMSLLAKRAGASPGVIYHYFPSKDALIHAVFEHVSSTKHEVFFAGLTDEMPAREALLKVWHNAYHFYRRHRKETRFLDQYLNSPYCRPSEAQLAEGPDSLAARVFAWLRPKSKGGVLKDLPAEAIDSLTLGLAADLAKAPKVFSAATLKTISETVWAAIADE